MKHIVKTMPNYYGVMEEFHLLQQTAPNGRLAASIVRFNPGEKTERSLKALGLSSARSGLRRLIAEKGHAPYTER